jgi:hypothetical protein
MREKVEAALTKLRPCFKDADISLRDISGDVIKERLKDEVPEIKEVIAA